MANFCLLPHLAEQFKKDILSGKIDPEKLSAMTSAERHAFFERRVMELVDEFIAEPQSDEGMVFSLSVAFFRSPSYLQDGPVTEPTHSDGGGVNESSKEDDA